MPRKSSVTKYEEPRTYWAFEAATPSVFPVTVVAESEHCLWLKPAQEFNRAGRPYQPVQRQKRALCTFHSFHEAKSELMEELQGQLTAARDRYEDLMEKAYQLEAPCAAR
jgi:hypothetical protein